MTESAIEKDRAIAAKVKHHYESEADWCDYVDRLVLRQPKYDALVDAATRVVMATEVLKVCRFVAETAEATRLRDEAVADLTARVAALDREDE